MDAVGRRMKWLPGTCPRRCFKPTGAMLTSVQYTDFSAGADKSIVSGRSVRSYAGYFAPAPLLRVAFLLQSKFATIAALAWLKELSPDVPCVFMKDLNAPQNSLPLIW